MGMLIEGQWTTRWYEPDEAGRFVRPPTRFRDAVAADGSTPYAPARGRYHLYVSYACPWAHRTLVTRRLKGLEDVISVSVVDPRMGDEGWVFGDAPRAADDPCPDAAFLRHVYVEASPSYTGRVTVPVLWDRERGTVVNNESREVMRMLDHAFDGLARHRVDLAPPDLVEAVDAAIDRLYEPVNNGVYRAGFATTQAAYEEAVRDVFDALDHWDGVLGEQRYVCGDRLTEADICLFTTLVRFDPVYHTHFKCNVRRIADYPNLGPYLRDLVQTPGIRETVHLDHIKTHYYWSHPSINPTRIVPVGPAQDLEAPHDRDRLGPRRIGSPSGG